MNDLILTAFLTKQRREAEALNRESDLVEIFPAAGEAPRRYRVRFRCAGLVRSANGEIVEADRFETGVWFPADYVRRADPFETLTWLGPSNVFHPNISDTLPLICIGRLTRGTPLVDIVYRLFDLITYNNVTMVETDALNRAACAWARTNRHRFPVDRRPLKRRAIGLTVEPAVRAQS
jgi:hypothetical protein